MRHHQLAPYAFGAIIGFAIANLIFVGFVGPRADKTTSCVAEERVSAQKLNAPDGHLESASLHERLVVVITPTYERPQQKAELTRLSYALRLAGRIHWVVVEDAKTPSTLVARLLSSTGLPYTHLVAATPPAYKLHNSEPNWLKPRGVLQRNAALKFLRSSAAAVAFGNENVDGDHDRKIRRLARSVWPTAASTVSQDSGSIAINGGLSSAISSTETIQLQNALFFASAANGTGIGKNTGEALRNNSICCDDSINVMSFRSANLALYNDNANDSNRNKYVLDNSSSIASDKSVEPIMGFKVVYSVPLAYKWRSISNSVKRPSTPINNATVSHNSFYSNNEGRSRSAGINSNTTADYDNFFDSSLRPYVEKAMPSSDLYNLNATDALVENQRFGSPRLARALRASRDDSPVPAGEPVDMHDPVVYFADDDNTYDVRLFDEMRLTRRVSVWPVGLVGGLKVERPLVGTDGRVVAFNSVFRPDRPYPIDMAGFAVSLRLLIERPTAVFSLNVQRGYQESHLLSQLLNNTRWSLLEPRAENCTKVLVWHTRTENVKLLKPRRRQQAPKALRHQLSSALLLDSDIEV